MRILVVNPFGIGDVLFSTPLVRAVRQAFPGAHIAYLCNRRTREILLRNPHVDELFIYEKDEFVEMWRRDKLRGMLTLLRLLAEIRRRRFHVAIDLSLGERYSFVLALLGVPRRVGLDFRRRGRFLTHRFAIEGYHDRHVVEYYAELLEMVGIRQLDGNLELRCREEDRHEVEARVAALGVMPGQLVIGLVPAGGVSWGLHARFRRWSKHGFIRVGQALAERYGARILIFGERADQEVCRDIAVAIGRSASDVSGQTTLGQFIGFIARCDLVISNDGGPVHIAASQGVRTVAIFGPVDPKVYGPYPLSARHRSVRRYDLPCRPCYHQFRLPPCPYERACLTGISASDVLHACEAALEGEHAPA